MNNESKICPKCGEKLEETYEWNPKVFGTEDNDKTDVCVNDKCEGWFCPACDIWHPYGTSCANYLVHLVRGKI